MTSKISFFNRALMRRDLARSAPLLGLFAGIWIFLLPIGLLGILQRNAIGQDANSLIEYIFTINGVGITVSAFLTGMAAAWLMFHDFFSAKSANFYAQLPICRETQFCTHYLDGLLFYMLPTLLIYAATAVLCHANGVPVLNILTEAFAAHMLSYLFFFGFGVLCCMLISNAVAMPLLYVVLNFTIPVVSYILYTLIRNFTYGMPGDMPMWPTLFSPLVHLLSRRSYQCLYDADGICVGGHIVIFRYLLIIAAVGLVMAVVSMLMFGKRKMETAGDVIAVPALRGVFRYAFTIGCALVIGMVIALIVSSGNNQSPSALLVGFGLIFGAWIGNFSAVMMLEKTIRVFKKNWLGWIVCSVLLALFVGVLQADPTGYERYVPDADTVNSVLIADTFSYGRRVPVTDRAVIEKALALQAQFISEKDDLRRLSAGYGTEAYSMHSLNLCYTLKNGKTITRYYEYPVYYDEARQQAPICEKTLALINTPAVILANKAPAFSLTPAQFTYTSLDYHPSEQTKQPQTYTLGNREAYQLFTECILPDLADTSLGFTHVGVDEGLATDLSLSFMIRDENAQEQYFQYTLTEDAARTLAFLEEKGYLPE